jgi:hypothetical protein
LSIKARSEPFDSLSDSETKSSNNNEMADAIELVQPLLSQKMSITEEDIIKYPKQLRLKYLLISTNSYMQEQNH